MKRINNKDLHLRQFNPNNNIPRGQTYKCMFCDAKFPSRALLHIHKVRFHKKQYGGGELQKPPFEPNEDPFADFPDSEEMHSIYADNEVYILEPHQLNDNVFKAYNFPINGSVKEDQTAKQMEEIYLSEATEKAYKLEISAGVILKSTQNGQLRYFKPEANVYLLETPLLIENRETLQAAITYLQALDLDDYIRSFRPDTKYQVVYITQLVYHCWMTNFPLGSRVAKFTLPNYVIKNRSVLTQFDFKGYENCCMLVCIAQHKLKRIRKENKLLRCCKYEVKRLLVEWLEYCMKHKIQGYSKCTTASFPGMQWADIGHVEKAFGINITIMELHEDKTATTKYVSLSESKNKVYMNLYQNHLSYICNIDAYSKRH